MFVLSKLLSAITQPLFCLAVWWALALLLWASQLGSAARPWLAVGLLGSRCQQPWPLGTSTWHMPAAWPNSGVGCNVTPT